MSDVPLHWYRQRPLIVDPAYRTLNPSQRLAIRELRDLAALQAPRGLPADVDRLAHMLPGIPRRFIASVLDDWFPVDPATGQRFDPMLREDQEHVQAIKEKRSRAGKASAARRSVGQTSRSLEQTSGSVGQTSTSVGKTPRSSLPGVEHMLNERQGTATTSPVRVGEVLEHMLNLTNELTNELTNGEAVDGGAAVEAALPPTVELPPVWSETLASLKPRRASEGLPEVRQ